MNMKKATLFLCGSVLLLSQTAYAAAFGQKTYFPNGFYLAAGGIYSDVTLKNFKLNQQPELSAYPATLTRTKKKADDFGFNLAMGYAFETFPARMELAYIWLGDIKYNANPLFVLTPPLEPLYDTNFKGKVNPNSVMLNGIIELPFNKYVIPFAKVGLGLGINRATGDVTVYVDKFSVDQTKLGFAWQAGLGLRFRITDNFSVDAEYRYADLGKAEWKSWTTDFGTPTSPHKTSLECDKITANEILLSAVFYFGDQDPRSASGVPTLIDD